MKKNRARKLVIAAALLVAIGLAAYLFRSQLINAMLPAGSRPEPIAFAAAAPADPAAAAAQLAAIETALFDFLEARMGEPLRGYATSELHRRLAMAGFPDAALSRLVAALDTCAFGRFAPSQSRQQGASDAARAALDVLEHLDRAKLPKAAEASA